MAREWTPAQAAAIATRDRTLLVSAAAGSGKTATLTERIIKTLTDPVQKGDISRMLVVTFTRSAAAELRARISAALNEAMAQGGHSPHLSRQLLLLPGAHISTIDSFCLDLVRANAAQIGLSPAFRLADPAEDRLLLHSAMNRLIEDCYEGTVDFCNGDSFCPLVDCLTGSRGDGELSDILLSLYDKTQGFARGHYVIADMADTLLAATEKTPFETPWGAYLCDRAKKTGDAWIGRYTEINARLAADPNTAVAYLPAFEADLSDLRVFRRALEEGYAAAREALLAFRKPGLKSLRADKKTADAAEAQEMRTEFYSALKKLRERSFSYTEEEWRATLPALAEKVGLIGRILAVFGDRVWEEKRRRGICSFNDLSHGALRLLMDENGNPTPLAAEIGRDFDAVYVDEYQDVNEVQHRLFELIATPRARFMVGDIKQSIYGFRGAQPEIFARIRQSFPTLEEADGDAPAASLSLAKNFRSLPPVLAFTNLIFGRLMEGVGAHIDYREEEDKLIPGRAVEGEAPRVTVALFDKNGAQGTEAETESLYNDEATEQEPAAENGASNTPDAEAAYVAKTIRDLLAGGKMIGNRPICPGDIAILLRRGAPGERFAKALAEYGIRAETASKRGFFLNPEILLALSLLNVIDNPRRDVYLAGLLRSPLYGFTMDDLINIRRAADASPDDRGCSLYEALCLYNVSNPDFEKGHRFLEALATYRRMAEGQPVDRLIWQLYRETGLLSLAGADKSGSPAARRANLMLLYDYARRFEASSYHGLYNFIAYINEAIERGQSIEEGHPQSERMDTVRIMTIHQSKGLEFPVCFLCDCGAGFMKRDAQSALLFDRTLGCGLKLGDKTGLAHIRNPIYHAISESILASSVEEEMRILYVALTRPRDRLYVTATMRHPHRAVEKAASRRSPLGAAEAYACGSYADMILAAAAGDPSFDLLFPGEGEAEEGGRVSQAHVNEAEDNAQTTPSTAEVEEAAHTLADRFSYVYPHQHLTALPGKMSVSRLYPTVLDESEADVPPVPRVPPESGNVLQVGTRVLQADEISLSNVLHLQDFDRDEDAAQGKAGSATGYLPRFMGGERDAAARAGTATHLFMQFCDFTYLRQNGAAAELARLTEARFLSAEDTALVRLCEIEAFVRSSLLSALMGNGRLYRELRFHARMPAAAFTADPRKQAAYQDETVLVQGVMDGVLLRPDGEIWLFDYKTDRLTAEEKRDPALAAEKLCARHGSQLSYYAEACRQIFGRSPDRVMIYSLPLGDTVDVPVEDII